MMMANQNKAFNPSKRTRQQPTVGVNSLIGARADIVLRAPVCLAAIRLHWIGLNGRLVEANDGSHRFASLIIRRRNYGHESNRSGHCASICRHSNLSSPSNSNLNVIININGRRLQFASETQTASLS